MHLRKVNNETLVAPRRGRPPAPPPGYEADPGDPYTFFLKMEPCEYREERIQKRPCCNVLIYWCTLQNIPVKRWGCVNKCPKQQ